MHSILYNILNILGVPYYIYDRLNVFATSYNFSHREINIIFCWQRSLPVELATEHVGQPECV